MFDIEAEDENLDVMTVIFKGTYSYNTTSFMKEVPLVDVFQQIYIPQDDRVAHSQLKGYSPDGKKHYHYVLDYHKKEVSKEVIDSFISEGWSRV